LGLALVTHGVRGGAVAHVQ